MISIITPSFNRAHLLPRMVNSVINQTFIDWELIIMDDGSTDDTEPVVRAFKDNRIKYFKSSNFGATKQRNKGVKNASGDYIIFLDSDDWAEPEWLEYLTKEITENVHCVITCGWRKLDENQTILESKYPENQGKMFNELQINYLSGSMLLPRTYFLEIGGYDEELTSGQHTELLIRLLPIFSKYETKINIVKKILVNIFIHKGDRVRSNFDGIYKGSTRTMQKHQELFEKNPDKYFNYLSIAAVCAFRTGRISESKRLTVKALRVNPFNYLSYLRLLIAHNSLLRNKIWLK